MGAEGDRAAGHPPDTALRAAHIPTDLPNGSRENLG